MPEWTEILIATFSCTLPKPCVNANVVFISKPIVIAVAT